MSKIKNGGLDQYGAKPFEQQRFGTAGIEGVKGYFKQLPVNLDILFCLHRSHPVNGHRRYLTQA